MRPIALLLVATLVAALVPSPAAAQDPDVVLFPLKAGPASIGFPLEGGKSAVRFEFKQSDHASLDGKTLDAIVVILTQKTGDGRLEVSLQSPAAQGGGADRWRGDLPAATPALVKAVWDVQAVIIDSTGATSQVTTVPDLSVTSSDGTAPGFAVSGLGDDGKVRLGNGDVLSAVPTDASPSSGLRLVTYELDGVSGGALPLGHPYTIGLAAFKEGPQELTLTASDRAGNVGERKLTVIVDTTAPIMDVTLPAHLFVGHPGTISVRAADANQYSLTFVHDGNLTPSPGKPASQQHRFTITPTEVGPVEFAVRGADALGNSVERRYVLNATILSTDATVGPLSLSIPKPLAGQNLTLRVPVAQAPGHLPLNLSVALSGAFTRTQVVEVAHNGTKTLEFPLTLGVGQHTVTANVSAPAGVVEDDPSDQQATFSFEIFFGKLTDGGTDYYIRADQFGLPSAAVGPDNATYALALVEKGSASVYEFKVAGNRTVTWDPSPVSSSSTTSSSDKAGKDSPAPAAALLALALVGLALARRRRA